LVDVAGDFVVTQALEADGAEGVLLHLGKAVVEVDAFARGLARRGLGVRVIRASRDVDLPPAIGGVFVALDVVAIFIDQAHHAELRVEDGVVFGVTHRRAIVEIVNVGLDELIDVGQAPDVPLSSFGTTVRALGDDATACVGIDEGAVLGIQRAAVIDQPGDASVLAVVGVGGEGGAGLDDIAGVAVGLGGGGEAVEGVVGVLEVAVEGEVARGVVGAYSLVKER